MSVKIHKITGDESTFERSGDSRILLCVRNARVRWNLQEEDFQIDFMDAVLSYPFLSQLTIYTGYKVTSTAYREQ
jgi:hypothetical protein